MLRRDRGSTELQPSSSGWWTFEFIYYGSMREFKVLQSLNARKLRRGLLFFPSTVNQHLEAAQRPQLFVLLLAAFSAMTAASETYSALNWVCRGRRTDLSVPKLRLGRRFSVLPILGPLLNAPQARRLLAVSGARLSLSPRGLGPSVNTDEVVAFSGGWRSRTNAKWPAPT
jgi:hypothetical protein